MPSGTRLADYGLNWTRDLTTKKGPRVFERELGELESRLMLTTAEKAVKSTQGSSIRPKGLCR